MCIRDSAWFDESPDPTDSDVTISNGIMDDGEKRLANVVIQFYEVQEDGTRKEAYNGDGELDVYKRQHIQLQIHQIDMLKSIYQVLL